MFWMRVQIGAVAGLVAVRALACGVNKRATTAPRIKARMKNPPVSLEVATVHQSPVRTKIITRPTCMVIPAAAFMANAQRCFDAVAK